MILFNAFWLKVILYVILAYGVNRWLTRWLWRKVKGDVVYYYVFGFLIIVVLFCAISLYYYEV